MGAAAEEEKNEEVELGDLAGAGIGAQEQQASYVSQGSGS